MSGNIRITVGIEKKGIGLIEHLKGIFQIAVHPIVVGFIQKHEGFFHDIPLCFFQIIFFTFLYLRFSDY